MKVIRLNGSNGRALIEAQAPCPQPGREELLIRVSAAGVILTELAWYPTTHGANGDARAGAVPCHEFSGVVAAVGDEVGSLEVGREVYGMNDWYSDGALAEYCVAPFFAVSPKPCRLTHAEAASAPISALTAWQGLFDRARLQSGESVLIHGAAGGVGIFATQLARLRGAHVIATASAQNRDWVLGLGAERVIDYHSSRFEESVKDMDIVFDTVGGETLDRSWSVLKPEGRMVTVASTAEGSTDPRARRAFFIVEPNQKQLAEVAELLDAGRLRVIVNNVIPLSEAPAAYTGKLPRQGRGKLVVAVAASAGKGMNP
jgi:NADPH:quinone reductase-like Zn-dependent oxidoreductase